MGYLIQDDVSKNKYQTLGQPRKICTCYKIGINVSIISICLLLIGISLWKMDDKIDSHIHISLKQNQPLVHIISDKFLSIGLDSSLLRNMPNLPINYEKFVNLARHLSPAYVRIGGTSADCLYFNQTASNIKETKEQNIQRNPVDGNDISNFSITSNDFLSLYKFTQKAGLRMLFDLNVLLRNNNGTWDSRNAKEIIVFAKGHGMELDWQMGNEPNSFFHVFNIKISAEQLAEDYCKLRYILNKLGYQQSLLVGPEANHIGDENERGVVYVENFLNNINNCIDYVTWHQYYLDGHVAQVEDFINSTVFNRLPAEINSVSEAIKSTGHKISMWISETSSAYGSGAPNLSDRFVAGFLWLDKLGYSAKTGVQVVIRQTLFGGYYAMVDSDLNPNPDWWVAVIFKQFVSKKVLNLATPDNFGNVRLYAHCASTQAFRNKASSVTVYGINLNNKQTKIFIRGPARGSKIFSYILTSDSLQSRKIFMNGEVLKLDNDGNLPPFKPKIVQVNEAITLPAFSMVFLLIDGMEATACLSDKINNL